MREVLSVVASVGNCEEVQKNIEDNKNNNSKLSETDCNSAPSGVKLLSSHPGYLELSEERLGQLISQEPIEDFYEVEDQPFARGKYATVRRCRCRNTGQLFAAKVVRKRRRSSELASEIIHEVAVLDACSPCPRIVNLHRVFESANDMVLLLELAAGGELQMVLDRDEVPEEREVARLMRQILHGLVFLHHINVAHLDLKPQNLVLTGDFPNCDVKLCDFGISRYLSEGADVREILGTPDYVAPEVLNYEPISLATDMWSVGVLMYVLLTGCSPFGGETKQETFCNISQCRLDFPDDLFEDVSDNAKDLLRNLIVKDPKKRLSAQECLKHAWFSERDGLCSLPRPVSPTMRPCSPSNASPTSPLIPQATHTVNTVLSPLPSRRHSMIAMDTPDCTLDPHLPSSPPASRVPPLCASTPAPASSVSPTPARSGISAIRRNKFMRNMNSLVQRLSVVEGEHGIRNWSPPSQAPSSPNKDKTDKAETSTPESATVPTSRAVSRATAMQTMPIRSYDGYKFDRGLEISPNISVRISNLAAASGASTSVFDLRSEEKESVFKFRKVYILEDPDDLESMANGSPPPSIAGSMGSSVYSDNSISDSNSDTISELSVDSSSDRSSIISLDDSWDMTCARLSGRPCPAYNVWDRSAAAAVTSSSSRQRGGGSRLFQRECNGSVARALSRFATEPEAKPKPHHMHLLGGRRQPILSKLAVVQTAGINNAKRCGLELMREQNGNLVVIREMREIKPGGRYARFSEVKCESVQSRIRKLQVQGAKA